MPGKYSEIKIEIDENVPDTSMHQAWLYKWNAGF